MVEDYNMSYDIYDEVYPSTSTSINRGFIFNSLS